MSTDSPLSTALRLEPLGETTFVGGSSATMLQRIFGGHILAQALLALSATVESSRHPHSIHGYFLQEGRPGEPTLFEVEEVRDGRNFSTRRVTVSQGGRAIFIMAGSFARAIEGPEHQRPTPTVAEPDEPGDTAAADSRFTAWHRREWPDWELRRVHAPTAGGPERSSPTQRVWLRHRHRLPDDPRIHAAALAYASDLTLLACCRQPHLELPIQTASLDHGMWFLRPFRVDEWLLYDQVSPSASGGRGLNFGHLFTRDGRLVACVAQEGLLRTNTAGGLTGSGPWDSPAFMPGPPPSQPA